MSQSELARRLGISSQAVNQWFKPGGTAPRGKRLSAVARAIGVELSELLGESSARQRPETLSPDQARAAWIGLYDSLSPSDRDALMRAAQGLLREKQPARPRDKEPDIPRPFRGGSAAKSANRQECDKVIQMPRVTV